MSESESGQAQEKTEEPSDKRKEEFREEGQIVRSAELVSLAVMGGTVVTLMFFGNRLVRDFLHGTEALLQFHPRKDLFDFVASSAVFAFPILKTAIEMMLCLFAIVLVASLAETGLLFSPKSLEPKTESLNPLEGIQKLFKINAIIQLLKSSLKIGVIGCIVYFAVRSRLEQIMLLTTLPLFSAVKWSLELFSVLGIKIGIFLTSVAIVDYIYQWRTLHQKMMMSRQDLREEAKESQVSDHVRSKVRQIQRERAKRTIQKEVPLADVIVTNPTHFSIALSYKRNVDRAPRVVAKGMDLMAALIRKLGTEHQVPIYEYPELARALYKKVRVGQTVPSDLYESVARVLSYVYQIHQRRNIRKATGRY